MHTLAICIPHIIQCHDYIKKMQYVVLTQTILLSLLLRMLFHRHCNKVFYTNYTFKSIKYTKRFLSVSFQIYKCIYLHTMAGPATLHINPGVPSLQSGTIIRTHPVLTRLLHGYLQMRYLSPADMREERKITNKNYIAFEKMSVLR